MGYEQRDQESEDRVMEIVAMARTDAEAKAFEEYERKLRALPRLSAQERAERLDAIRKAIHKLNEVEL